MKVLNKIRKKCIIIIVFLKKGNKLIKLFIFSIITMIIIISALYIINKKVTNQDSKDSILKLSGVLTVFFHYSSLFVDYFLTGEAKVENTMLIPIYPCNVCMWLLLIVAFKKNKDTFMGKSLMEFLAIGGTICGLIGLFGNEIFISNPNFLDYNSLKGLLSHSTMIFGTLFILTGGYVKFRTLRLTLSMIIGLTIFLVDGILVNSLFALFSLDSVNSMYLLEFPLDIKGVNSVTIGIFGVIIIFIISAIYEKFNLEKEERWYSLIKCHLQEKHNKE